MSDLFFVELIGGSIVIAAIAVIANMVEGRAYDRRYRTQSRHSEKKRT